MRTMQSDRDYAYGAVMLTLRTKIGLTQAELANQLGITRLAVGKWEAGSTYPKPERLKALIELAFKSQAFPEGAEAEEIRALWKMARQKVLLDEHWLSALLAQSPPSLAPMKETLSSADVTRLQEGKGVVGTEVGPASTHSPEDTNASVGTGEDGGNEQTETIPVGHQESPYPGTGKTRERRKLLMRILIAFVILTIIGSAGMLLFQTREPVPKIDVQAYPGYLSGHGTLVFFDALSQRNGSRWPSHDTDSYGTSCQFTGGAYHISAQLTSYNALCAFVGEFVGERALRNFAFEVQLTITQGDCGGIDFSEAALEYDFRICQDGTYMMNEYAYHEDKLSVQTLSSGSSSAIHAGRSQQNKIAVVAYGSTMTFYVNERQIGQVQDSSPISSGEIFLMASPHYGNATDVAYSNARLWTLETH